MKTIPVTQASEALLSFVTFFDPIEASIDTRGSWRCKVSSDSFADSLRQLILLLLSEGYPSLSTAAKALGISARTFQRRLEENNLNYSQLVEQVRFEQASRLLQDPDNHVIDIAFDLGYGDAANFTRAFKRWTGVSPREFRHSYLTA